jgi:uncharacterized BrkB/YihY/UPF0761 family membrane protein
VEKAEETGNAVGVPMAQNLGLVELLKQTFKEASKDHLAAFAGNLTYKGLFALFPFFVFLLSLLGLFGASELVRAMLDQVSTVLPEGATTLIEDQLLGIVQSRAQGAFTVGAIISILLALWGISGAFRSVMEAMNVMYEVKEARPLWKQYLISIFLSLGVAALLLTALGLVVFGPQLGGAVADAAGFGFVFRLVWNIMLYIYYSSFIMLIGAELNQVIEEHIPEGKNEGEKTLNIARVERKQAAAGEEPEQTTGEAPERIEHEMSEIRSQMSSDLSNLREHVEPQAIKERLKQNLWERLCGILNSAKHTLRRRRV